MTVKELKEKLNGVDENLQVGGSGWFGEFLECEYAGVDEVFNTFVGHNKKTIFLMSFENAGPEPD